MLIGMRIRPMWLVMASNPVLSALIKFGGAGTAWTSKFISYRILPYGLVQAVIHGDYRQTLPAPLHYCASRLRFTGYVLQAKSHILRS